MKDVYSRSNDKNEKNISMKNLEKIIKLLIKFNELKKNRKTGKNRKKKYVHETFYEEIAFSHFEDSKEFEKLYRMLTSGKNNFMLTDLDLKDERLAIRRNFSLTYFFHYYH